jgi:hypothetical protein
MCPAFCLTDYKVQSKTLSKVILDLRDAGTSRFQDAHTKHSSRLVQISRAQSLDTGTRPAIQSYFHTTHIAGKDKLSDMKNQWKKHKASPTSRRYTCGLVNHKVEWNGTNCFVDFVLLYVVYFKSNICIRTIQVSCILIILIV